MDKIKVSSEGKGTTIIMEKTLKSRKALFDILKKNETNSLAENNLGLVHLCANRFRNKGIEYDDLYGPAA